MFVQLVRRLARAAMVPLALTLGLSLVGAAHADPALWKVQGPKATVYLFGTVHVLKPDVVWRKPAIEAAIKSADALWLEVPNADDQAAMQPLVMTYGVDPSHPLSTKIDAETKAKFDAFLAPLGVSPAQMEPFRPWMAGLAISTLPLIKAGYDLNSGVEHVIKGEMQAAGKPVLGFETAEQQIRYLADIPPAEEIDFFKSSLSEGEKAAAMTDGLVAAWSAGDEAKLETLLNGEIRDKYPSLYKRLIVDRNLRFADKIAGLANGQGVVFVAIGAGHLVGSDSVQTDLAKLGLKAIRQ